MVWDLIQIILLAIFIVLYIWCSIQHNVLLMRCEKLLKTKDKIIFTQKKSLETAVKISEYLHRETFDLLQENYELEKEREKYLHRCVLLEDENSRMKKLLELTADEKQKGDA